MASTTTPTPFDPVTIGPITLRNRFIKSGANEAMCLEGKPTKALVKHHRDLAAGGVGMTTVAYMAVAKVGRTLPNQIWMRPEVIPDLRVLTQAVHAEGAAISAQITHGGSFVTGMKVPGRTISSSSGFNPAGLMKGNILQRAMNEDDMARVEAEFVQAAELAREGGFDAVELHMGHGYLLNQFISPLSNRRTDEYGGSAENRVRFPARVLAAVKGAVGKDMAAYLRDQADLCGVPHDAITVEITETAAMQDDSLAVEMAEALHEDGFKLAIDDFGSGATSLAKVRELKFEYLKLDGILVKNLAENESDREFVAALSKLAHDIGVEIIAEFVQDESTMEFLAECEIEYAQGYFIGEPEPFPS